MDVLKIRVISDEFFVLSNGGCKTSPDEESFFTEDNSWMNELVPGQTTEPLPSSVMPTHFTGYGDR